MSLDELEQRIQTIEKEFDHRVQTLREEVVRLKEQLNGRGQPLAETTTEDLRLTEEDLIDGAEYDIVLDTPPKEVIPLKGVIVSVTPAKAELALSEEEWDSVRALMEVMDERNGLV